MLVGHVGAAVSFLGRVGLSASFPLSLSQSGSTWSDGAERIGPADSVAPGDLRLGARVRLLGRADRDAFSLHVATHLWLPTGRQDANTSDGGFRVEPRLVLGGRAGPLMWSTMVGFAFRPTVRLANVGVGQELRFTVALGASLLDDRLFLGPEAYVVSNLGGATDGNASFFSDAQWGGEALLGVRYRFVDALVVGAGGGIGLERGFGIPAGRALFTLAWAPVDRPPTPMSRPLDSDGDGVLDPDDGCVTTPEGSNPDPAHPGCPLADSDGDGLFDGVDRCITEPQSARPDPSRPGCPLRDRDSDGVFDPDDQCPEQPPTPTADPARRGCPARDGDGDGVLDHDDRCPEAPRGAFPDPSRPGCPTPDADGDLVADATDACRDQPGVPSLDAARNGCPNALVQIRGGAVRITQQVQFNTNRDRIKRVSFPILQAVADTLRAAPFLRRVSVQGHTDNRSTPARNLDLSRRRADAVMRWLIEHGVAAERLESQGFGQAVPIATNDTPEGREQNRRVEFRIVDPAPPGAADAPPPPAATTPAPPPSPAEDDGRRGGRRRRHRRH
jgi:outer membrane protein OmpA-like peptidoglycan-associated protein